MKAFENHHNYNCKVTLDNGEQYNIYSNWLNNNQLNAWLGWHCEAGVTRISIDKNLEIWSGECHNDRLGDSAQGWELISHHSVCRRHHCTGCTDDLLVAKWKP